MDASVRAHRGRWTRWLLLGTALVQAGSPLVAGFDQGSGADPVVVPPGPFFAVWGVVVLGSVAAALWGLPLPRATRAPWTAVQVPVSVAQIGFVVWLLTAATAPALTLPVFLVMLGVLTWSLRGVWARLLDRVTRVKLGGLCNAAW